MLLIFSKKNAGGFIVAGRELAMLVFYSFAVAEGAAYCLAHPVVHFLARLKSSGDISHLDVSPPPFLNVGCALVSDCLGH